MNKFFIIVVLIFILQLCQHTLAFGLEIIGKVSHFEDTHVTINVLFGRFYLPPDDIMIPLNKEGGFSIQLDVKDIRFAELTIGSKKVQLFLNPAYTTTRINIAYNGENSLITFTGGAYAENNFINERPFTNYHIKLNQLVRAIKKDPQQIDAICTAEEAKDIKDLSAIQKLINKESYAVLKEELRNYYITMRMVAGMNNISSLEEYKNRWLYYNDSLSMLINCDTPNKFLPNYNHLIETIFAHLTMKYNIDRAQDTSSWLKKFDVENSYELSELTAKDHYNKIHYVVGKDQMCPEIFEKSLATRIHRALADGDFENLAWLFEKFKALYPDSPYLTTLEPKMTPIIQFEQEKAKDFPNITFYPVDTIIQSLHTILQKPEFKHKVVLIDIWGTWCGSCREEFPFLKDLKAKLQKEPVAYLYLANEKTIKNPESHWKEVAKYYYLTGYHYLLNQAVLQDFWTIVNNKNGMQSYPTYLIISKNGEVAVHNAAMPSDGDVLYQQIMQLVKE